MRPLICGVGRFRFLNAIGRFIRNFNENGRESLNQVSKLHIDGLTININGISRSLRVARSGISNTQSTSTIHDCLLS